jgi:hypothetical protein
MLQQLHSKIKNKKALLILILLVLPFQKANAQTLVRGFTVSPPAIEVKLAPGEKVEGVAKVINDSGDAVTFGTSLQDFIVKDNLGVPQILPPDTLSNKYSGAAWIAVYPSTVTVPPHKSQEVNYYIQVPADAKPGGRYAALIYTPFSTLGVKGTGASVQTSVGTLFYITVKGPVNESANVSSFKGPGLIEGGPVEIKTEITNMSDIHIAPEAKITLTNFLGGKSDEVKLATYNIFPEATRQYQNKVGKGFMFGPYKAVLSGIYGSGALPLSATLSFWVIPWKLILFVILLVVAVGLGTWLRQRRFSPPPSSL